MTSHITMKWLKVDSVPVSPSLIRGLGLTGISAGSRNVSQIRRSIKTGWFLELFRTRRNELYNVQHAYPLVYVPLLFTQTAHTR